MVALDNGMPISGIAETPKRLLSACTRLPKIACEINSEYQTFDCYKSCNIFE